MRRLLSVLSLALLAAPATAGEVYYQQTNGSDGNIYAASESGTTPPRVVLAANEYPGFGIVRVTYQNHAAANGQAFLRYTGEVGNLELLHRDTQGQVITTRVTDLGSNTFKPFNKPRFLPGDQGFSFRARDDAGNVQLWRLNVSVDQALAPGYEPPTGYADTRLALLATAYLNPASNSINTLDHAWESTGNRVAYHQLYQAPNGSVRTSYRVLNLATNTTTVIYDALRGANNIQGGSDLEWCPASDELLQAYTNGSGLFALHADTPGLRTWVLPVLTTSTKGKTTTDIGNKGVYRPDGNALAFFHYRSVAKLPAEGYVAITTGGWANAANVTPNLGGQPVPFGWSP